MKRLLLALLLLPVLAAPLNAQHFVATAPKFVPIVGTNAGVPHPGFEVRVHVQNAVGLPFPGAEIVFDFSNMVDVRLCRASIVGDGAVNCANKTITAMTNAAGQVVLTVIGGSINNGFTIGHGAGDGIIFANGTPIERFTSPILDQNGAVGGNGVDGVDLSLSLTDINRFHLGWPYVGRSDHNRDGGLSGADLAVMLKAVNESALGLGSASGCFNPFGPAPYCP